ncbi:MAG: hypothetical protein K940chlam3_00827 [Chlamydiae bacterium]|nr:hypothetical protein [Chlamydiota bacterium]
MEPSEPEAIPGYVISIMEGVTSGVIAFQFNICLGRYICNLSNYGTGFYCGVATVLHTLIMADFQRPRDFIKSKIPAPLKNRVALLAVDTATSTLILGTSAYLTQFAVSYSADELIYLSCLTEGTNLIVSQGIGGVFRFLNSA